MQQRYSLTQHQQQGLMRTRIARTSAQQKFVQYLPHALLNFSSNDYLGLANHPEVVAQAQSTMQQFGVGSGSSQVVSGYTTVHQKLEQLATTWLGVERTLLFSNGYMANLGVITALADKSSCVIQDKHNHASIIDATVLSGCTHQRYRHLDLDHCETLLNKHQQKSQLLVSETVFSMDGQSPDIERLTQLAQRYQAQLVLDDAHGIGWHGPQGRSVAATLQNTRCQPIIICPLGKAIGSFGAIVAGTHQQIEHILQFARSYIYTTALPPALAAASVASIRIIQQESWRRERLQQLIDYFRHKFSDSSMPYMDSHSPIQCLTITTPDNVMQLAEKLKQQHLLVAAIRPPTAPQPLLRVSLTCQHTEEEIDYLFEQLQRHATLI